MRCQRMMFRMSISIETNTISLHLSPRLLRGSRMDRFDAVNGQHVSYLYIELRVLVSPQRHLLLAAAQALPD